MQELVCSLPLLVWGQSTVRSPRHARLGCLACRWFLVISVKNRFRQSANIARNWANHSSCVRADCVIPCESVVEDCTSIEVIVRADFVISSESVDFNRVSSLQR